MPAALHRLQRDARQCGCDLRPERLRGRYPDGDQWRQHRGHDLRSRRTIQLQGNGLRAGRHLHKRGGARQHLPGKSGNISAPMIIVDAKTGMPFKFSDITMQGRLDALQGTNRTTAVTTVTDGGLYIKGAARNFKIFNARFTKFLRTGIEFQGDAGTVPGEQIGVIYRNEFIDNWYSNLGYGVAIDGSVNAWNRPIALGTANAVFVEDNLFVLNRHCVTSTNGANYVARYNTVRDNYQDSQSFDAHGLSPAWPRGTRSVEIYGNVVTNSITRWAGAGIRGGSGVVWGNTWNGVSH